MPDTTITSLPAAASANASAVVAADNAAGTLTEKVTLGQIAALAGGVGEAPADGTTYGRKDGDWTDIAQAANLQLRRGTEAERVQITPLQGEPIYTTDSKKFYIGDGSTVGGNEIVSGEKAPQQNPPGMARMVTIRNSGTFSVTVRSSTGFVAALWWDGSVQVFGAGAAANDIAVSRAVPTSGNWSRSAPKEIFIWSCTSGNATQSGGLTSLTSLGNALTSLDVSGLTALTALRYADAANNVLTSLDVSGLTALTSLTCNFSSLTSLNASGCTALTDLNCGENALTSLNVSGCTALTGLVCTNNALTSLDVSGLTALTYLDCHYNALTSLNVSGLTALTILYCNDNDLASLNASGCTALTNLYCFSNALASLNASGLTALTSLRCNDNALTSLNVSGCTALTRLHCNDNALISVRAAGVALGGDAHPWYGFYGGELSNNQLDAAALNQFYTDLAPNSGYLMVENNPGTTGDDPTIATAKGYTVFGS